jgi:hypothetical protein
MTRNPHTPSKPFNPWPWPVCIACYLAGAASILGFLFWLAKP